MTLQFDTIVYLIAVAPILLSVSLARYISFARLLVRSSPDNNNNMTHSDDICSVCSKLNWRHSHLQIHVRDLISYSNYISPKPNV